MILFSVGLSDFVVEDDSQSGEPRLAPNYWSTSGRRRS
jgi:hypothetical protein